MNRLILLLGICFLLPGFVAGEGKTFTIDGSVKELTEGEMLVNLEPDRPGRYIGRGKLEKEVVFRRLNRALCRFVEVDG